tara:strand:- start:5549 stop:5752 length:204 start_codon:yes stop_codon:yes gene_type:complete
MDSAVIFIGEDTTLTTANGIELAATTARTWTRTEENTKYFYTGAIYARDASGTSDVRVWERLINQNG